MTMNRRAFLAGAAGTVLLPRAALARAARPDLLALVTADLESHVVVFDLRRNVVLERISTARFPRSIETVGGRAVVAHSDIGLVSVIDGARLRVAHVLDGFGEPRYVAAHPDGRHAYVTDAARGEVVLVDVAAGRLLAREPVGPLARHVTIRGDAERLWIALGSKASEVAVVEIGSLRPRLLDRFAPPFLAHDVGFAPDARHAWVSSGAARELAVYDLQRQRVVARPSGGWPPQHVTFSAGRAFVTSGWSGRIDVHEIGGRHLRRAPVPVGSSTCSRRTASSSRPPSVAAT